MKMEDIVFKKENFSLELVDKLIPLSKDWISEEISYGIVENTVDDFLDKDIYVVYHEDKIIGYLLGKSSIDTKGNSAIKKDSIVYNIEEVYIIKDYRNKGIGKALFKFVEEEVCKSNDYIDLITSDKDYKRILHFYIDELGMSFNNAYLVKKVKGDR